MARVSLPVCYDDLIALQCLRSGPAPHPRMDQSAPLPWARDIEKNITFQVSWNFREFEHHCYEICVSVFCGESFVYSSFECQSLTWQMSMLIAFLLVNKHLCDWYDLCYCLVPEPYRSGSLNFSYDSFNRLLCHRSLFLSCLNFLTRIKESKASLHHRMLPC